MKTELPIEKDLVLIGGGHSHALVLKMWAMNPLSGVRLSLISPNTLTPYSGMLPGLVAGHYTVKETHIDLVRLSQYAGVRFIQGHVTALDLNHRKIQLPDRAEISYDVLSINCGIIPDISFPGAQQYAIPVKPIAQFYPQWKALLDFLASSQPIESFHIVVVGGGAAGVELILSMQYYLIQLNHTQHPVQFHLVLQGQNVPEGYPVRVQQMIAKQLAIQSIQLHQNFSVAEVQKTQLVSQQGDVIAFDSLFLCTNAKAGDWLKSSGLTTDSKGFVAVNGYLQSTSHGNVFAAGDIACMTESPRPKAGVFAVRQGGVLFKNLKRYLLSQPLSIFKPQKNFLSLLACGGKTAVACRTNTAFPTTQGDWVWRWKDHIDQKFMRMFNDLATMTSMPEIKSATVLPEMRCNGCGAKVGASILSQVMAKLKPVSHDNIIIGLNSPDDASVIQMNHSLLVQSVDSFRAIVDDPYLFGQIAALHALSDLFAMNAQPHSALAIVTLPHADEVIVEREMTQLMQGAVKVLNEHDCALVGGHSSESTEMSLGFSVNGFVENKALMTKSNCQVGDILIITQALGTGALFAAHAQHKAEGEWIEQAVAGMLLSNHQASKIFFQHQAKACTDVTGFGLLGHLLEMLKPVRLSATLNLADLPVLSGVLNCFEQDIKSSLYQQNSQIEAHIVDNENWQKQSNYPLLFDPQTSGGLLATVPPSQSEQCLSALRNAGYADAVVIGCVTDGGVAGDACINLN